MSESTKGILIFHQYGYPQNNKQLIEKAQQNNWFIIEDCSHALNSYYKNKRLGSFGDVGIFSLSDFFPSFMGGAIITKNKDLSDFVRNRLKKTKNWGVKMSYISRMFYEKSNNLNARSFWSKWVEMSNNISDRNLSMYPKSQNIIKQCLLKNTLDKRNKNKNYFQEQFSGYNVLPKIENHEKVLPYVLPFLAEEDQLIQIVSILHNLGIRSGIHHFDVNRDMINPDFVKCICIPVHGGINQEFRKKIVEAVFKVTLNLNT